MTTSDESDSYVLFELAGATYAVPSRQIQQLEMVGTPTPVPNAPPFVDGVVSVRGQVIPAVSLRARFGFPRAVHDVRSRLVIIRAYGRTVGLIVDSAREFANIAPDDVKPLPEGIGGTSGRYLRGIAQQGERLLLLVDVRELLETGEQPTDTVPAPAGIST
jgi:purine-binding chemotaxis protein CheW